MASSTFDLLHQEWQPSSNQLDILGHEFHIKKSSCLKIIENEISEFKLQRAVHVWQPATHVTFATKDKTFF